MSGVESAVSGANDALLKSMQNNAVEQAKVQKEVGDMNHKSTITQSLSNAATNMAKNSKGAADKTEM